VSIRRAVAAIGLMALFAGAAAPSDLKVTAKYPEKPTGTMHYAEAITLAVGDAKPLVLDGEMLPIPGPHLRLADSRFLLLGWSSPGSGMQSMHVLLIAVRDAAVVVDGQMVVMTDRPSAGLLVRVTPRSARIGLPQPPSDFVHDEEEWFLNLGGGRSLNLEQMRKLVFARVHPRKDDLFYNEPVSAAPMPKRVAWIDVTPNGFALAASPRINKSLWSRSTNETRRGYRFVEP